MKFESKFGIGEIVIRESHKNRDMVQERMMEVIGIVFGMVSSGVRETTYIYAKMLPMVIDNNTASLC